CLPCAGTPTPAVKEQPIIRCTGFCMTSRISKRPPFTLAPEDVLHIPGLGFDGIVGYSHIALEKNAIGLPNNEAQFLETRKFQVEEICRIFRVPAHPIGNLEHAIFSKIEKQYINFCVHTIRPWQNSIPTRRAKPQI
ncbi:MAG: phage portal protein, partial [Clostridia bacterium]